MVVGKLTSSTKKLLKDAQQSLADAHAAHTAIGVASAKAQQAIRQYLDDNQPSVKGTQTGGAQGDTSPGSGGGLIPNKSAIGTGDDAAGVRCARYQIELLNIRKRP
jgi:hypothetical protein